MAVAMVQIKVIWLAMVGRKGNKEKWGNKHIWEIQYSGEEYRHHRYYVRYFHVHSLIEIPNYCKIVIIISFVDL